ncbi:hypothetical protein GGU45_004173 [Niabella hirudinis]
MPGLTKQMPSLIWQNVHKKHIISKKNHPQTTGGFFYRNYLGPLMNPNIQAFFSTFLPINRMHVKVSATYNLPRTAAIPAFEPFSLR